MAIRSLCSQSYPKVILKCIAEEKYAFDYLGPSLIYDIKCNSLASYDYESVIRFAISL